MVPGCDSRSRSTPTSKRGRDLFDLWLALTELRLDPDLLTTTAPEDCDVDVAAGLITKELLARL
jgi:hypothetical protein